MTDQRLETIQRACIYAVTLGRRINVRSNPGEGASYNIMRWCNHYRTVKDQLNSLIRRALATTDQYTQSARVEIPADVTLTINEYLLDHALVILLIDRGHFNRLLLPSDPPGGLSLVAKVEQPYKILYLISGLTAMAQTRQTIIKTGMIAHTLMPFASGK